MNPKLFYLSIVVLVVLGCNTNPGKQHTKAIAELEFLSKTDTLTSDGSHTVEVVHYYIVDASLSQKERDIAIQQFVDKADKSGADQISYVFLKASDISNEEHLKRNPRDLDRYSQDHDFIWTYNYVKKLNKVLKFRYKDGEIVTQ